MRKFSGVFPFFVQGEVYEGDYFEEALYPFRPVGYSNKVMDMWFEEDFKAEEEIKDDVFSSVKAVEGCKAPGALPSSSGDVASAMAIALGAELHDGRAPMQMMKSVSTVIEDNSVMNSDPVYV